MNSTKLISRKPKRPCIIFLPSKRWAYNQSILVYIFLGEGKAKSFSPAEENMAATTWKSEGGRSYRWLVKTDLYTAYPQMKTRMIQGIGTQFLTWMILVLD